MSDDERGMTKGELIVALRSEAGRSGTVEFLKLLRSFSVWQVKTDLPYPIPMAGPDFWGEVLDVLIAEAEKG